MNKLTVETHVCPANSAYKVVLDFNEAVPDDPGAGTPAMVYGPEDASGTFYCALDTGELDEQQLPPRVSRWLGGMAEHVDQYLDCAFDSAAGAQS